MFAFWIAAAALSAAAGWLMLRGARAAMARAGGEDPAVAVHRRQLAEIDDLAARDLLPADEVRAARAEAGRRLLAAADAPSPAASAGGRRLVLAAAIAAPLLAVGLYLLSGAPGASDQPYARRLADWEKHVDNLTPPEWAALVRHAVGRAPPTAKALVVLAEAEANAGDAMAATTALRRAVGLEPDRADLWVALGMAFITEGDGEIGADARVAFSNALRLDPASPPARYFLARADIADGKVAQGLAGWRALLASVPAGDPLGAGLSRDIAAVEKTGGLPRAQPAPARPDAAAIRGMVEGLARRLEAQPNDPQGWVRLVRAWSVLGETAKRDAALARARGLFKGRRDVLDALDEAAQ